VRLHVEFDPVACETLRSNEGHHSGDVLEDDVENLHGRDLRERGGLAMDDPLIVVGGPPCQPFSKAAFWSEDGDDAAYRRARAAGDNAVRPKRHGHRNDSRRFLIDDFLRLVIESEADGFVFENVASLLAPRNRRMLDGFLAQAERAGYRTTLVRANSAQYGVPQKRERIFVLGSRRVAPAAPSPTHSLDPADGLLPAISAGKAIKRYASDRYFEDGEVVQGRWAEHLRTVPPGWNY